LQAALHLAITAGAFMNARSSQAHDMLDLVHVEQNVLAPGQGLQIAVLGRHHIRIGQLSRVTASSLQPGLVLLLNDILLFCTGGVRTAPPLTDGILSVTRVRQSPFQGWHVEGVVADIDKEGAKVNNLLSHLSHVVEESRHRFFFFSF
jgi:hypothetical protein